MRAVLSRHWLLAVLMAAGVATAAANPAAGPRPDAGAGSTPDASSAPASPDVQTLAAADASESRKARHTSRRSTSARSARLPEDGAARYAGRDDAMALADALAAAHGLDPAWAREQLAQAHRLPTVARLIAPPAAGTAKDWAAYRDRFVEPRRIAAGRAFWRQHQRWLAAAETRYGVPAQLVVGIIGVETYYGRITGDFRVLDALATLSLDYPAVRRDRSAFFRDELGQFLALTWRQKLDPQSQRGSYAGAMGLGQFMPGSINRHAVDFDGDGRIDMVGSTADVIGSVAHYLAAHGWTPGMATHYAIQPPVDTSARATLLAPDIQPSFSAERMAELGAALSPQARAHNGPLALVELQNGSAAPSYVAGTSNFYTVTRYNHSSYYALAVIDLGQAVADARAAAGEDDLTLPSAASRP